MIRVVAVVPEYPTEARLEAAVQRLRRRRGRRWIQVDVERCPSRLVQHLGAGGAQIALVAPRTETHRDRPPDAGIPPAIVEWLRNPARPPTAIWASSTWLQPRRVLDLGRLGLRRVIVRDQDDDPAGLGEALEELVVTHRGASFLAVLPPSLPDDLLSLIEGLLLPRRQWPSVDELADLIPCDRSTLYRKFEKAGLPPPREFLGWIRIYLTLRLTEGGLTCDEAARRTGFGSTVGFARMAKRRLDVTGTRAACDLDARDVLAALRAHVAER